MSVLEKELHPDVVRVLDLFLLHLRRHEADQRAKPGFVGNPHHGVEGGIVRALDAARLEVAEVLEGVV